MKKDIIISVHGVGLTQKGELITGISKGLSKELPKDVQLKINKQEAVIDGYENIVATSEDNKISFVEINWSDVLKPKGSIFSLLRHLIFFIFAMLSFAEKKFYENNSNLGELLSSKLIKVFRFFLEGLFIGSSFLVIISTIAFDTSLKTKEGIGIIILLLALYALITYKAGKFRWYYKMGWLFLILFLIILTLGYFDFDYSISSKKIAEWIRIFVNGVLMLIWLILCLITLLNGILKNHDKINYYLAIVFFFSIPFIAFNGFCSIITLVGSIYIKIDSTSIIPYNLWKIEKNGAIIYTIIGVIPIIIALVYFFHKQKNDNEKGIVNEKGKVVQKGLSIFLKLFPVLLIVLYVIVAIVFFSGDSTDKSILDIYKKATLRIIPYIAWIIGPLSIAFDAIGDVLFYLEEEDNDYATKDICFAKIKSIMDCYGKDESSNLIILAHSWGSKLMLDYINENKNIKECTFLTIGSPIDSICNKFLDIQIEKSEKIKKWVNIYRYGDYIAGPIDLEGVENKLLGNGGHTNYWSSKKLAKEIKKHMYDKRYIHNAAHNAPTDNTPFEDTHPFGHA